MVYVFAVLFGLNARGAAVLTQILLGRYFGRRSFGAISSVLDPFHKGGLGLGALFAGIAFDFTGNYRTIFAIFLGKLFTVRSFDILGAAFGGENRGLMELWNSGMMRLSKRTATAD